VDTGLSTACEIFVFLYVTARDIYYYYCGDTVGNLEREKYDTHIRNCANIEEDNAEFRITLHSLNKVYVNTGEENIKLAGLN
jgi:hypothetical protein